MNLLEAKLAQFDPEVDALIRAEMVRSEETINLIASENYPPKSCMKAISSMRSGIYSEGYPDERYYCGLENVDRLESLAIQRAKDPETSTSNQSWPACRVAVSKATLRAARVRSSSLS